MELRKIWIGCLAAYNAGHLHGQWYTSEGDDIDDLSEYVREVIESSPVPDAEEYFIADHDGYDGIIDGEPSLQQVADAESLLGALECSGIEPEHFAVFCDNRGDEPDVGLIEAFEEAFCGVYDSRQDYAEELFDELYMHEVPEHIQFYIDYEAFARDLFIGDCWSVHVDGGLAVFRNI